MPFRALALSAGALAIPVAGAFWIPGSLEDYAALLWLLALIPAFLLAYYRGWQGVATALAGGMAVLSLTQAAVVWLGGVLPDLLLAVVAAFVLVSLGVGWLAELFLRDVERVEDLAFTDLLTRLPNRRHARVFLENEFAAAERGRLLSVVLFDLDEFKRYNDRYGHQLGDEALRIFADVLGKSTRKMNLSARFGGEEFVSILAGSDAEGAMIFADRVRKTLKARELPNGSLSVSAGVAAYNPSMRSPDELLAAADHALYRAKRDGRDCVRLFGRTVFFETADADESLSPEETEDPGRSRDYPRPAEEIGRSAPPLTLLPHQTTDFGAGRKALVVDDEKPVRELISSYLTQEGFTVAEAGDVRGAVRQLHAEFDVVVVDLRLPGPPGTEVVQATKSRWPATQVIVITGLKDSGVAAEALSAGADRYLYKPFGMPELRSHITAALSARDRVVRERGSDRQAARADDARTVESRQSVVEGIRSLVRAAEIRDPYLRNHGSRVWAYANRLARVVDPDEEALPRESLRLACEVHDVGRLRVPATILGKEDSLSIRETERVQEHPGAGRQILEPILDDTLVLEVVSWHHERWDGSGYPDGLAGEAIPLGARLVAVADTLDALTSARPQRAARSWESAINEIRDRSGSQFDPALVDALEAVLPELREVFDGREIERSA